MKKKPISNDNEVLEREVSQKEFSIKWIIALLSLVLLVVGGYFWKTQREVRTEMLRNRILAERVIVLGEPLPVDYAEQIDISLLERFAESGDGAAQDLVNLIGDKKRIESGVILGEAGTSLLEGDIHFLKADAEAGNRDSQFKLELYNNRVSIEKYGKLGEAFPDGFLEQLDQELLKQDADAGNEDAVELDALINNRRESEARCQLGQPFEGSPFEYDFYDHVDRGLLKKDADAGYEKAREILRLADNRIEAARLTRYDEPYPKDFFEHVDRDLLLSDADAGNTDMQYVWARLHLVTIGLFDEPEIKVKYYQMAAEQNHTPSMISLAGTYKVGNGVEVDVPRSLELYRKAAELGDLDGMYFMAYKPFFGVDVKRDLTGGLKALREVADLGHVKSQQLFGSVTFYGSYGVPQDTKLGLEMLTKAAQAGDGIGQYKLGHIYSRGEHGVAQDLKKAEEWYIKSTIQSHSEARVGLINLWRKTKTNKEAQDALFELFKGASENGVAESMALYAKNLASWGKHSEALEWAKKAAATNHNNGLGVYADFLRRGVGVEASYPKAMPILKTLARRGRSAAIGSLTVIYRNGRPGVPVDYKQSMKYADMGMKRNRASSYHSAAILHIKGLGTEVNVPLALQLVNRSIQLGNDSGYSELGMWYLEGEYVEQDIEKGVEYLEKGIAKGNSSCMNALGEEYLTGKRVKRNTKEGLRLLKLASKKNNSKALYYLGTLYENGGSGVKKNRAKAKQFYKRAADSFSVEAKEALKRLKK